MDYFSVSVWGFKLEEACRLFLCACPNPALCDSSQSTGYKSKTPSIVAMEVSSEALRSDSV
jgi:hypothetical protein